MIRTFEALYQNVMDIISSKKRSKTESDAQNEQKKDSTSHDVAQEYMCPCCLEVQVHPMILVSCGHTFCRSCLVCSSDNAAVRSCGDSGWSPETTAVQCYSCRADITSMIPNRTLESAIQALISSSSVAVFSASDIETYHERSSKSCGNAGTNVILSGNDSDRASRRGGRRIVRARRPFQPPPQTTTFEISPVRNRAAAAAAAATNDAGRVDGQETQFNIQDGILRVRQALERMHQIYEERGRIQAEHDNESAVLPGTDETAATILLDDVMQQLHEENEQIYHNYDREEANLLPVVREAAAIAAPLRMTPYDQEDLYQQLYAQRDRIRYNYDDDIANTMPFPDDLMISFSNDSLDLEVFEPPQQVRSTAATRRARRRRASRRSQRLATRPPRRQQT